MNLRKEPELGMKVYSLCSSAVLLVFQALLVHAQGSDQPSVRFRMCTLHSATMKARYAVVDAVIGELLPSACLVSGLLDTTSHKGLLSSLEARKVFVWNEALQPPCWDEAVRRVQASGRACR
jgi:hypothetical protein